MKILSYPVFLSPNKSIPCAVILIILYQLLASWFFLHFCDELFIAANPPVAWIFFIKKLHWIIKQCSISIPSSHSGKKKLLISVFAKCTQTTAIKGYSRFAFEHIDQENTKNKFKCLYDYHKMQKLCSFAYLRLVSHQMLIPLTFWVYFLLMQLCVQKYYGLIFKLVDILIMIVKPQILNLFHWKRFWKSNILRVALER